MLMQFDHCCRYPSQCYRKHSKNGRLSFTDLT